MGSFMVSSPSKVVDLGPSVFEGKRTVPTFQQKMGAWIQKP